jgi:DNA-binding IscR family transcriptional regulator
LLAGAEWPPVRNARPALDDADVRQFVLTQLGKMSRASIQELAARYVAHVQLSRQVQLDAAACRPRLEEVVRKLQHDGLVSAANGADGLYLLARRE